jgi:hypothetical protein
MGETVSVARKAVALHDVCVLAISGLAYDIHGEPETGMCKA